MDEAVRSNGVTVLSGMDGVGKTQLARAFENEVYPRFRHIWWANAEQRVTLDASYAGLAKELQLPESDYADQSRVRDAVRDWLERNSDWLLIFDNAQNFESLDDYLPAREQGRVLATSHSPRWRDAKIIPVRQFDRPESIAFLRNSGMTDSSASDELADRLGDLPLALEQAIAYLQQTHISPDAYVELLRKQGDEIIAEDDGADDDSDANNSDTDSRVWVGRVWSVALERITAASREAKDLLFACTFLAPESIPRDLFSRYPDVLPKRLRVLGNLGRYNRAIRVLDNYSLVTATADSISVHRVLQAVVRQRLSSHDRRRWAGLAVFVIAAAFPQRSDDVNAWLECQELLPHALAATRHSEENGTAYEASAGLLNRVALYLWARGEAQESQVVLNQSQRLIEERLGADHLLAADNLSTQGKVLRELGYLTEARSAHERALQIRESHNLRDHPDVAWSLGNLGRVLRKLGDLEASEKYNRRAVKILEDLYGPDHPDVAWALGNLGRTLQDRGSREQDLSYLEEAEKIYQRALAIRKQELSLEHPDTAWSLRALGSLREANGKPSEAIDYYRRAYALFRRRFGDDHPEVLVTRAMIEVLIGKGWFGLDDNNDREVEALLGEDGDLSAWRMAGPGGFRALGDGVIESEGGMGLLWYGARTYEDFVLEIDWMATSPDDNSGIFVRFPDPGDDPWVAVHQGYEIQIDDRPTSTYKTGAVYGFAPPTSSAVEPIGSWNRYEIAVTGQLYTVRLNGREVNRFTGNRGLSGYIGLQNHDERSKVRFRNALVRPLY